MSSTQGLVKPRSLPPWPPSTDPQAPRGICKATSHVAIERRWVVTTTGLQIAVSDEVLEELVSRIVDRVHERLEGTTESPWLNLEQAAAYLACKPQRLYKRVDLPRHKHGGRLMFRRDELDAYIEAL